MGTEGPRGLSETAADTIARPGPDGPGRRRLPLAWLGVVPFFAYSLAFLLLPSAVVLVGAFKDEQGSFTTKNVSEVIHTPQYIHAFQTSIEISLVTAVLGGLLGFLMAYAAIRPGTPRAVRPALTTFSGVAANFAGVPLAFAFIATLGTLGIVTKFLNEHLGIDLYANGFTLFSFTGVCIVYMYFQIPLMILVIAPAIDGLRPEWREASANLGGSSFHYWRYVGVPGVAALAPGRDDPALRQRLRRLRHGVRAHGRRREPRPADHRPEHRRRRALESAPEPGAGVRDDRRDRLLDGALRPAPAARLEVDAMKQRLSLSSATWLLLGTAYFVIPLLATLLFSLQSGANFSYNLSAYSAVIHDSEVWSTLRLSAVLALETIVLSLLLLVPTAYWVHLKLPRVRPYVEFLTILPFVVPPIILVVGVLQLYNGTFHAPNWFLENPHVFLVATYVILAFPYVYRSLDAGFRAIDVHTLTEASQSLGATWTVTLRRVILPNIRLAALGGAFLTLAIVMGEFTIASLALFNTFPTYINLVNQQQVYEAAALSLVSFGITWVAMLGLLVVGGAPGRRRARAGAAD